MAKKGFLPTPFVDDLGHPKDFGWGPIEDMDFLGNILLMFLYLLTGVSYFLVLYG